MFAIAIELLAERYTATQFNDRNEAEWPPHPARLYSAMVATWADSDDPDQAERSALRWLEDQSAPEIHCGDAYRRTVVTHFVPVNDPSALTRGDSWAQSTYASLQGGRHVVREAEQASDPLALKRAQAGLAKVKKKATDDAAKAGRPTGTESAAVTAAVLEVLPENRGKQGRTYPTVIPSSQTVWFVWPDAIPSLEVLASLDGLLGRVGRLGHSSTLVACRANTSGPGPDANPTWVPGGTSNAMRLRIPRSGLLDHLERAFEVHHGEEPRTLPAGMVSYRPHKEARPEPITPLLGGDWYVLGLKRVDPGQRVYPSAIQALALTRAVRGGLLKHGAQPPSEFLSGHEKSATGNGPTPPLAKAHLAIVPLLNAGNSYSDGTVFGVALVSPKEATAEDTDAVETALSAWAEDGFELAIGRAGTNGFVRYVIDGLGVDRASPEREPAWLTSGLAGQRKTLRRDYWCRPAKHWVTVTPIALDRFPGNLRSHQTGTRERAEAEACFAIAKACIHAGLGPPTSVAVRLEGPLAGIPASPSGRGQPGQRHYPGFQTGRGAARACVHAEIEFPELVAGPVLIGAGRYLGYGLCLPHDVPRGRARTPEARR